MSELRRDAQPRRLVRAPRRRDDPGTACGSEADREQAKSFERIVGEGALEGQHRRRSRSSPTRSTASRGSSRDPPLIVPIDELADEQARRRSRRVVARSSAATGRRSRATGAHLLERFRFVDVARKVVGVGSVGTRCWIVLLLGRDTTTRCSSRSRRRRPRCSSRSSARASTRTTASASSSGQRLMQAASDIFLGWVRDRRPRRRRARLLRPPALGLEGLGRRRDDAAARARQLRAALRLDARPRARALRRPRRDRGVPRQERRFDPALAAFADAYADQNERDHARFARTPPTSGRIAVEEDVRRK